MIHNAVLLVTKCRLKLSSAFPDMIFSQEYMRLSKKQISTISLLKYGQTDGIKSATARQQQITIESDVLQTMFSVGSIDQITVHLPILLGAIWKHFQHRYYDIEVIIFPFHWAAASTVNETIQSVRGK